MDERDTMAMRGSQERHYENEEGVSDIAPVSEMSAAGRSSPPKRGQGYCLVPNPTPPQLEGPSSSSPRPSSASLAQTKLHLSPNPESPCSISSRRTRRRLETISRRDGSDGRWRTNYEQNYTRSRTRRGGYDRTERRGASRKSPLGDGRDGQVRCKS